jgi:hypothetical protein
VTRRPFAYAAAAALALGASLVWAWITFLWFLYRVDDYCEDESAGCTEGAPVRSVLMAIAAVAGIAMLLTLAVRSLRAATAAAAPPQDLRGPFLRALAAGLVWFAFAAGLLIE